jgi:beta-N-acetylhexosaminidase
MIAKYRLGGLILTRRTSDATGSTNPSTNSESPEQVRALTTGLQEAAGKLPAGVPLLIGTDQEYGSVTRIREGVTQLPSAMAFGAAADPALTEAAWRAAGTELAALGVNVDFAPVADVLGTAGSGVIGSRSYGTDPAVASGQVAGAVRGLQAGGVAATLKHFPGHGHTTADSHSDLPVLSQNRAALNSGDLPPFQAGIDAGAWLVMSGHLDVRSVEAGVPATFSRKVLTGVLRDELGFGGIVVTDSMGMAPARTWPVGEAAVRAVLAGNDVLLMPPDLAAAQAGLLAALKSGRLPRAHLVESVTRILTVKLRLAAFAQPAMSAVGGTAHAEAVNAVSAAAVTLLRGSCQGPLVKGRVTVTAAGGGWARQREALVAALRRYGVEVVASGGTIVHLVGYADGSAGLRSDAGVTVAMDTPYVLGRSRAPVLIATYSSTTASMEALAAVLAGKARPTGHSPVPVSGLPRTACG